MYIDKQNGMFLALILFVMLYLGLTFAVPPDPIAMERYQISPAVMRLLLLSISLPLIGIWYTAFYGFTKLKNYVSLITQSPDGRAYRHLANGVAILGIGLPLSSVVSTGLNYIVRGAPDLATTAVIIEKYLDVAVAVAAFTLIHKGARLLLKLHDQKPKPLNRALLVGALLLFGGMFVYLVLKNSATTLPAQTGYRLPHWLLFTTIILPYLYVWMIGSLAAYYIASYAQSVKGVIYKQSLRLLAQGLGAVILSSILLQYFKAIRTVLLALDLSTLLGIVYLLLLAIATGYVLIASGAKRLQKLEEV